MDNVPRTLREKVMHGSVDTGAHIALVNIEFLIHHASSLKDKRRTVNSVKDRLRARFNAAVAEIGYLDEWQRCGIGVVMLANERAPLEREVNAVQQFMLEVRDIELTGITREWL